jgi:hypothetical protein
MMHLFYIILITNYENKQGNKFTPEFGFVSNKDLKNKRKRNSQNSLEHPHMIAG